MVDKGHIMEFVVIGEIWNKEHIQYATAIVDGTYIPKQDDMKARNDIVETLNISDKGLTFLDITGVMFEGELMWSDIGGANDSNRVE